MEATLNHESSNHSCHMPVNFFCAAPQANKVELEGDFNNWQPSPMVRGTDGWWIAQVELERGYHRYRFLLDGHPMLDPQADIIAPVEEDKHCSLILVG